MSPPSSASPWQSPRSLVESGQVTLPQVFEWNAKHNPHHPVFVYHDGQKVNNVDFMQCTQGIRRAARYLRAHVPVQGCVAVFAHADSITHSLTSLGILRAGCSMFLISTRNVPAAIVDMLRKTDCHHVLASSDAGVQDLLSVAMSELTDVTIHPMPTFEDIFPPNSIGDNTDDPDDLPRQYDMNAVAMILHSSGSTNHPKPIRWSHKRMMHWTTSPWYGEVDITCTTLGIHGAPLFHAMGVYTYCLAANFGVRLATFPPTDPPTFPTPENVFDGLVKTSGDYVFAAPAVVETWSRDPEKVAYMRKMRALIFGGAPLSQEVGDGLASAGVTMYSLYGCTEVGALALFFPDKPGMNWAYFKLNPLQTIKAVDRGEGLYEIVVLSPDLDFPIPTVNCKIDGVDAYRTNDLVVQHPKHPDLWMYYGRLDDQIVLSNGEKTNPMPLEDIINEDPHILACLIFGHGKFQNGVLVEPKPEYKFDGRDEAKLGEFRNLIWSSIERVNQFAPQHSRIFKEMIMVSHEPKPFVYNIKGYPRRPVLLKLYHEEIEALYRKVEQSTQSDVASPSVWDRQKTQAFVKTVAEKVIQRSLTDNADFFRNGCDSLQATWIRNTILRAVREHSPLAAQRLPMSIVFQAPSVSALTSSLLEIVHGVSNGAPAATTVEGLIHIAERYSADLPARPTHLREREEGAKDVVLVTGTTGGFGCDVLEHLLRDERVGKVYAFNRNTGRQSQRFRERGLDEELLKLPKFKMVDAVLDAPDFGLAPDLLDEIRGSVTHVMHNAWTVNFNLALASFEPDLKAVRNLIDLGLSSPYTVPPKLQFVSSIGIFEHCSLESPIPEVAIEASSALGAGYSESKWVAEKMLLTVAERASIPTVIVRLGQISGDITGHWNEREWFPTLVKSAEFTKCLPDVEGNVSFILGYPAALAFVEMRDSPALTPTILHLVHPRPTPWRSLLAPIAEALKVPLVSYADWISALEREAGAAEASTHLVDAMRANPALRLLDFFRSRKDTKEGREPLGTAILATEKSREASTTLATLPAIGEGDAMRWVEAWQASGFLAKP